MELFSLHMIIRFRRFDQRAINAQRRAPGTAAVLEISKFQGVEDVVDLKGPLSRG